MKGFVVRFKTHGEYINTLESLKKEGYLGEDISVGTSMSDTVDISDAFCMPQIDKRFHYARLITFKEREKVKGGKYIIIDPDYHGDEVSALSIGIDNRPDVKKKFNNLLGKDDVMVSLHTVFDDENGDIYGTMVKPEDVLEKIKSLI